MTNREIIEAINDGIRVSEFPAKDIEDKIIDIFKALDYLGLDFSFFEDQSRLTSIAYAIKDKYRFLTDRELTVIIYNGCQGEFKKLYQNIKGYNLFSWIKEYLELRQKALQNLRDDIDEDKDHKKFDVEDCPVGQAIIWKMDNIKTEDWDKIPLKELAYAIKNKEDKKALAGQYGVNLD